MAFESVAMVDGRALRSAWKPVLIDLADCQLMVCTLRHERTHSLRFCPDIRWASLLDWPAPSMDVEAGVPSPPSSELSALPPPLDMGDAAE